MEGHNYKEAWDDNEFRKLYKLFEEDEDPDKDGDGLGGLDRGEFRKLVVRMA